MTPIPSNKETESFHHLAETLPQVVWTATAEGKVDYLNAHYSRLTGIPPSDPDYLLWMHSVHPDDIESVMTDWNHAAESGSDYHRETRLKTSDGSYIWLDSWALPIRDSAGRIVKWYGIGTDINRQKQAELLQAKIAADKDNFLTELGHELRNPLAAISTSCAVLGAPTLPATDHQKVLKLLTHQTQHLSKLIESIPHAREFPNTTKVLIIENDPDFSKALKTFLKLEGHQAELVDNGESALALLQSYTPAIIFCDLGLPGELQGWDLVTKIRQKYHGDPQPYLIAVSGRILSEDRQKSLECGFDEHLPKPAKLAQIRECLTRAKRSLKQPATLAPDDTTPLPAYQETGKIIQDEDHFRHLAEALPQIVWTADARGAVDYVSSQYSRLSGVQPHDPDFLNPAKRTHPDQYRKAYRIWLRAVRERRPYRGEYQIKDADGNYRWFSARAIPLSDSEGNIVKWYGTTIDVEKQKQAESDQRKTAADKERMIADLNRDLSQPLRLITEHCQLLQSQDSAAPQQIKEETLQLINEQVAHIKTLLDQTLTISHLDSGGEQHPSPQLDQLNFSPSSSTPSREILIIEDNVSVSKSLELFFITEGHQVQVAPDGESAFRLLENHRPDIIFCDLSLPGKYEGWDIAEKICQDMPNPPHLIALSGHAQPHHIERCLAVGFHQHLAKPAALSQLREILLAL